VISNREGVVQYDFDKEELEDGKVKITHRNPPRAPSASLIETARLLQASEMEGYRPWLQFIRRTLETLSATGPAGSQLALLPYLSRVFSSDSSVHTQIICRSFDATGYIEFKRVLSISGIQQLSKNRYGKRRKSPLK
jgi:hypothetical protein